MFKRPARNVTSSALAAPSTGAAARRTRSNPPRMPASWVRPARGTTLTSRTTLSLTRARVGWVCLKWMRRRRLLRLTRPMQEDFLLAADRVLLANEGDRVVDRGNDPFEARFHFAPFHAQAVDFALHVFEPRLRLLKNQIGAPLGFAHDLRSFAASGLLDVIRQLLSREQRVPQVDFLPAVLLEQGLEPRHLLPQAVGFSERCLVVVRGFREKRVHLAAIVAAHHGIETLLTKVERRDFHGKSSNFRSGPVELLNF